MELNENMIAEIAGQLGLRGSGSISHQDIQRLEGKSDAELEREILQIQEQLAAKGITYSKQISMLQNLMPMMDSRQKARLQKIIGLMER